MQPRYIRKVLAAASVNNIAQSQTPGAAGNLILNGSAVTGGVAILDTQRQILITEAASEVGHNFTIVGTDDDGNVISEVVAGTAGPTATSARSYKTITRISISAAATGALQVGTNTIGDSQWQLVNWHVTPINIGLIGLLVSGAANFTVSYTYEDPTGTYPNPFSTPPTATDITALTNKSATTDTNIAFPIAALRLRILSGTGTIVLVILQAGIEC